MSAPPPTICVMAPPPRPPRIPEELERGASEICSTWVNAAELVHFAETTFPKVGRSLEQEAVITALVVHYRCMVNFVAGDYGGQWHRSDLCPEDFVGRPWWSTDHDLDRVMRARLRILNTEVQHISWKRLENRMTMWPFGYLIREVNVALCEFTEVLVNQGSPGAAEFDRARSVTHPLLPYKVFDAISYIEPAAPR